MKIRSLLLGSVAAAGLSTGGAFAADLGVLTSLDLCDELGLSGLTISSDDNCLVITGNVEFTHTWSNVDDSTDPDVEEDYTGIDWDVSEDGDFYTDAEVEAWLKFAASANTDFGKATAVIKIINDDSDGEDLDYDEAYVSIGDTTVITAGLAGSIGNFDDDEPLDWLGGFISEDADSGVYDADVGGGLVLQVTHDLGNGFSISGALEDLNNYGVGIGVLTYSGDGISAHVTAVADYLLDSDYDAEFAVHAGFAGEFDAFKIVLAASFFDEEWTGGDAFWNVLASASYTIDMFTLAGAVEATSEDAWGVSGSVSAEVTEGVTLNLGGRFSNEADLDEDGIYELAAGITADVTETLEANAKVGYVFDDHAGDDFDLWYAEAGLTWTPGGDYEASVTGKINSEEAVTIETSVSKAFQ